MPGNPNPDRSGLRPPFEPGKAHNPGGKTSEQKKAELANAEKATRVRTMLLDAVEAKLKSTMELGTEQGMKDLSAEVLKLIKDAEDRGLGSPKQTIDGPGPEGEHIHIVKRTFIDPTD